MQYQGFALKGYKHHKELSEETTAYTATVLCDGKPIGTAKNQGHGGSDFIHLEHAYMPRWNKMLAAWRSEIGDSDLEVDAAFIAWLHEMDVEEKTVAKAFKGNESTKRAVVVDTDPETLGETTFYNSKTYHYFNGVTVDLIQQSINKHHGEKAPRRFYERHNFVPVVR